MRHAPIRLVAGGVRGTVSPAMAPARGQGTELLCLHSAKIFLAGLQQCQFGQTSESAQPAQPSPASHQPTQMLQEQEVIFNFDLLIR